MFVIPSIDILNGKCVQLINGKAETAEIYGSPQKWINKWQKIGAEIIHIIDLNAALGIGSNKNKIIEIIKNNKIKFQVGGGIKKIDQAVELIEAGAERIIIGSKAIDQKFIKKLNKKLSKEQIMLAIDLKNGFFVTNGWKTVTDKKFEDIEKQYTQNIGSILSTDINCEGLLKGPDKKSLKNIIPKTIPTYVSGGFTKLNDIKYAEKLGFSGVIIGRALYKKKLIFEELW